MMMMHLERIAPPSALNALIARVVLCVVVFRGQKQIGRIRTVRLFQKTQMTTHEQRRLKGRIQHFVPTPRHRVGSGLI